MELSEKLTYPKNFIKYLGTSGGRFSMIKQARSTGGIWFSFGGLSGVIDPGPGSLVHICAAEPHLDSESIEFVMLTHKHIDHTTDANVLIECMTHGGYEDRGLLVAPNDALYGDDPVIMKYSLKRIARVEVPEDGKIIDLGKGVTAEAVAHRHHGVKCFGYIFRLAGHSDWGLISDTRLLPTFANRYAGCRFISVNTTFPHPHNRLEHMSVDEALDLIEELRPESAVLTHLGAMLTSRDGLHSLENLDTEHSRVTAATDGMVVDLDTLEMYETN